MDNFLLEPQRSVPIWHDVDVCVLGGSCTGVFAAIRAARLGARVVLVEKGGFFGGVATLSLVCVWHTLHDTVGQEQIIGGLTSETLARLDKRGVLRTNPPTDRSVGFVFNPEEMKIELDEMVLGEGVVPMLHTSFCAPLMDGERIAAVMVENKTGRGAIRAKMFVDATGDGDLAARAGFPCYFANHLQPATTCAVISGWKSLNLEEHFSAVVRREAARYNISEGFIWGAMVPGSENYMLAGTRIVGTNPADADDLTRTEIEGRRQVRAILDILREASPEAKLSLAALPARVGLRESRHVRCGYQLKGDDVLWGTRFPDAIANGSYRVDIHHQDKPGITLRYLDGTQEYCRPGFANEQSRWRPAQEQDPTFYQIPLRSLIPDNAMNLVIAGRMVDADPVAHGAIRVMVNMNQTGEAAGTAAALAANAGVSIGQVEASEVRKSLAAGGSIIL